MPIPNDHWLNTPSAASSRAVLPIAPLRDRANALAAEYRNYLDELPAGEAGLIEAERRDDELVREIGSLSKECRYFDEDEILSTVRAVEDSFWEFIRDREPETLAGIAVKLRWLRELADDPARLISVLTC